MTEVQKNQIITMRGRGATYPEIAAATDVSESAVKTYCWRHKIEVVYSDEPTIAVAEHCQNCGKTIIQEEKKKPRRFCSDKCRNTWWNNNRHLVSKRRVSLIICAYCGKEFERYGNSKQRYCSHSCYINDRFGEVKSR